MNLTTNDGAKIGKKTWRVTVGLADQSEPRARTIAERDFQQGMVRAAKDYAERTLRAQAPAAEDEYYWADVLFGEYVDGSFTACGDSFTDHVTDATWQRLEDVQDWHAWRADTETVHWGEQ
jgi:hypothetical protein